MRVEDELEARALLDDMKALTARHGAEFDAMLLRQRAEIAAMSRQVDARLSALAAE